MLADLVSNPNASASTLLNLAETVMGDERMGWASFHHLERLLAGYDNHPWHAIAHNPSSPVEILLNFAASNESSTREVAAAAPRTPAEALAKLLGDANKRVRFAAAQNVATPASALADFLNPLGESGPWDSEDPARAAARNPSVPPSILRDLVDRSRFEYFSAIARNPSTPTDVLLALWRRDHPPLEELGANPSTPSEIVDKLASHFDPDVRSHVAINSAAPISTIRRLSADADPSVRAWIAQRESTSNYVLDVLASDRDKAVALAAARNTSVPVATLTRLAVSEGFPGS